MTEQLKQALRRPYPGLPVWAKKALWRWVPPPGRRAVARVVGPIWPPLDAAPLARIATETLERLSDPDFLSEDLLPAMGLTTLGASDPFYPPQLGRFVGSGVRSIQFPNQFGPYLAAMTQAGIRTYLEIGVEMGGTFAITVEVLRRFGLRRALAIDVKPPAILEQWNPPDVEFFALDSHSSEFANLVRAHAPIDLAFIDGDHSASGVRADFETLRPHTRILAFHDIVEPGYPEVREVWRWLKSTHPDEYEFCEYAARYPVPKARLGIGVAIRRSRLQAQDQSSRSPASSSG